MRLSLRGSRVTVLPWRLTLEEHDVLRTHRGEVRAILQHRAVTSGTGLCEPPTEAAAPPVSADGRSP